MNGAVSSVAAAALQCVWRKCHANDRHPARPRHGLRGPLVRHAVDHARSDRDDPRQFGILARVDAVDTASRRQVSRGAARPARLRRVVGAEGLRLHREGARRRHRALPRRDRRRALPPDRREIRRVGLHAIRQRSATSPALALPVRLTGARQRHRQRRLDPRQGRAAVGDRDHAGAARQRGAGGATQLVGGRADGQDRAGLGVRRVGGASI